MLKLDDIDTSPIRLPIVSLLSGVGVPAPSFRSSLFKLYGRKIITTTHSFFDEVLKLKIDEVLGRFSFAENMLKSVYDIL
ncbi:unnamed protein product [Amoebophrya sp. A25]|nr:unnamed protein product [Amoebophrya sp. A25]|eukprot:GSA25T00011828001.1